MQLGLFESDDEEPRRADHVEDASEWEDAGKKRCTRCGGLKGLDGFYMNTAKRDGRSTWCRVCNRDHNASLGDEQRLRQSFGRKRSKAGGYGLAFELTFEQFTALKKSPCVFCGKEAPDYGSPTVRGESQEIDRVRCTRGYTIENVQAACRDCNMFRGMFDNDLMLEQVRRLAEVGLTPGSLMAGERSRREKNKKKRGKKK